MKSVYVPGHKVEAPCERCGRFVPATFRYDSFSLDDGTLVRDVMLARCDVCNSALAVAQQSAHAIKAARAAREAEGKKRTTLRLPRPLYDFAANETSKVGTAREPVSLLLKAFLATLIDDPDRIERVARRLPHVEDPVLLQPCDVSIPLYLSEGLLAVVHTLRRRAKMKSTSEVLRRVLVLAEGDRKVDRQLKMLLSCA